MSRNNTWVFAAGMLVPLLGIGLHLHIASKAEGGWSAFTFGLLAWSTLPYVLCLVLASVGRRPLHAVVAALCCLGLDIVTYRSVFVSPSSSTAALGLLFSPLANLLVMAPLGFLATALIVRLRRAKTQ
ncbi:hypothetical protein QLQ15_02445 [Lysobacter sp. LF1]|uniref:Uncharacterized protein n=1 Tax=Lysobacter stagni TaxID=3045172 RepID=A0ABT6XCL2_9GAMM|nr:hypothetical protein [Lysobacter sp. LF1]MDI9237769.1 hypothetical protein [Lysobacter sp. LF1]